MIVKKSHFALSFCFVLLSSFCMSCQKKETFTNWKDNSTPINELINYVEKVTNQNSQYFIPQEDRIAVFDLDGTLYCETFPIYGEWLLFSDYVLNNSKFDTRLDIKEVAEELATIKKASDIPSYMEEKHISAHAKAFAGMAIKDYYNVVDEYKTTLAEGYTNLTRGDAFYLPMLEIVDYLIDNEFIAYICSGTNRFTVRGLIDGVIDIPARQVIGSDFTIVASGQGDEKDMHYSYTPEDELLMGDSVIIKNVKMSKVAQLEQELGQKPVLAFGNSTGDVPMAHYVDSNNPYLTEVFFVLCDDITREHGNISKADKISSICNEFGWNTISMADDWKTIYGDNVTLTNQ